MDDGGYDSARGSLRDARHREITNRVSHRVTGGRKVDEEDEG